jgi:uncharacterized membrane protein YdjX (TVP38/TMEM64 family)
LPAHSGPTRHLKWLALFVLLACGAALLLLRQDVGGLVARSLAIIRAASPAAFFAAMAVLPGLGVPLSLFSLTAGALFRQQLGMPLVLTLSLAAITANMALCHVLANRLLRPSIERLVRRLGHRLPAVQAGDITDLIVLLRATPGVPFPVQNYLLGLAGVPFPRYLLVSSLIAWPLAVVMVVFGEGLAQGNARTVLVSLMGVVALLAATHMVRRHVVRRAAATAGPPTVPKRST